MTNRVSKGGGGGADREPALSGRVSGWDAVSVIREPIIRESQPADLPEGVVRSATSATVNHGIEELAELDLKSRFSLFEHFGQNDQAGGGGGADGADAKVVRRSQSLLTRLRRFDASGSGELVDSSDEGEGESFLGPKRAKLGAISQEFDVGERFHLLRQQTNPTDQNSEIIVTAVAHLVWVSARTEQRAFVVMTPRLISVTPGGDRHRVVTPLTPSGHRRRVVTH